MSINAKQSIVGSLVVGANQPIAGRLGVGVPNADLTGYATEQWVQENYLAKDETIEPLYIAVTMMEDGHWECDTPYSVILQAYNGEKPVCCDIIVGGTTLRLTTIIVANNFVIFAATSHIGHTKVEINSANVVFVVHTPIPRKPEDIGAQPAGNYLTEVPEGYATEQFVEDKIADAQLSGGNVDLTETYITSRGELEVKHEDINTEYILGLYDELVEVFPDKVQKREIHNNDGSFTNYEYVFSSGEYNTEGIRQATLDRHIRKPKYLVLSGLHGSERKAVLSTYRFFSDIIRGQFLFAHLREGSEIHVVPVGNPSGVDAFTRGNENGIDLNRNFDWNWSEKGAGTLNYTGPTAASEKETQAITNWLNANSDAELFIDYHNSSVVNEVALLIGLKDDEKCDEAKEIALRGLGRIVPYWRDVIGYPPQECRQLDDTLAIQDPIFSLSVSISTGGGAIFYATEAAGIPSLCLETSALQQGNYSDFEANPHLCPPETIAAGAEALGNIMLEFYSHSGGNSGGGVDFTTDKTLTLKNGILSVNTTNDMEQDNTRPITSAGVYAAVGNIEALLKTI